MCIHCVRPTRCAFQPPTICVPVVLDVGESVIAELHVTNEKRPGQLEIAPVALESKAMAKLGSQTEVVESDME